MFIHIKKIYSSTSWNSDIYIHMVTDEGVLTYQYVLFLLYCNFPKYLLN